MLQTPLKSAATRTRGAKICTSWLNASAASVDKRDTEQYGHRPVFANTEVADTVKAEMQKILNERPGNVMAPPRTRQRLRSVRLQVPELATGEASAVQSPAGDGAGTGCEDAAACVLPRRMPQRCMTMTLRPSEGMGDSGKNLVNSLYCMAVTKCIYAAPKLSFSQSAGASGRAGC